MLAKEWDVFLDLVPRIKKRLQENIRMSTATKPSVHFTPAQIDTLYTIATQPEWRMSDLSERLQVSAGSLTTMINRLIKAGVVERSRSEVDRRVVTVSLNQAGHDFVQANKQQVMANLESLLAELPRGDIKKLNEAMRIVIDTLMKVI